MPNEIGLRTSTSFASTTSGASPSKAGQRVTNFDGNDYVFIQAGSAVAQFDALIVNEQFQAFPMTTTNAAAQTTGATFIAVAAAAAASAEYFWGCIRGRHRVTVLTACNPNVALYTTATAGALDDTVVSTTKVHGLTLSATASGTTAITAFLTFPVITSDQLA